MIDIKNKKFNRLLAIEYYGKSIWKCQCDCGKVAYLRSYNIIHGRVKSCGCLLRETARELNKKKWGESALTHIYLTYKKSAENRGYSFSLSKDDMKSIIDKPCYYCGALPSNEKKSRFNNGSYYYNGIDRVNNNLGYELENVVPCCWICNERKKSLSMKEFLSWVSKVYLHVIIRHNN